jgi:leucyl-tRNA synthetase
MPERSWTRRDRPHFSDEHERVMRMAGLSIDWRRRFTTVDPTTASSSSGSSAGVKGLCGRGAHPVALPAPTAVGDHDPGATSRGDRFVLVMFHLGDTLVPTATSGPRLCTSPPLGQPDVTHVRQVDGAPPSHGSGQRAAGPRSASSRRFRRRARGSDCDSRACGRVPILPAAFVDGMATGVVMSFCVRAVRLCRAPRPPAGGRHGPVPKPDHGRGLGVPRRTPSAQRS